MLQATIKGACLAAAALVWPALLPAAADETRLIFATTVAPSNIVAARYLRPWAERVNAAGKGVLQIDLRDGPTIANATNFYSRVLDDVVQISWGTQNSIGGKFPLSSLAGLPGLPPSAEIGSEAFWRLYKSGALDSEYGEIVPLILVVLTDSRLHLVRPVPNPADLRGIKISTTSKMNSEVLKRVGATPLSAVNSELYETLQRRTTDGATMTWTGFQPFKLAEVTAYHLQAPFGASTGMVFMAKKRYEALPPEARRVLDENAGPAISRAFGRMFDQSDLEVREETRAAGRHQIVDLTPEQRAQWDQAIAPVIDDWARSMPDGPAVLARYRDLLKEAAAR